jgi:hypothetical protein
MHWKQRLLLLQERVSPPRPKRDFGGRPTPVRPGPRPTPPTVGRTPTGQFVPIPDIDTTIPQSGFFEDIIRLIAQIYESQPTSSPQKQAFFRQFSEFLSSTGSLSEITSQQLNDLLRHLRLLGDFGTDVEVSLGNPTRLLELLTNYSDMGSAELLQFLALRYGLTVERLNLKINAQITFDVYRDWMGWIGENGPFNKIMDDLAGIEPEPPRYIFDELGNLQSILLGLGGEGANADAMRVIRNQLLESINSGNVVGILENMIRYHAQLTDMFSDMVDLLDTVDLPADIREEITRNLETFYQNFTAPQFGDPDTPFGVLIRYLMGEDLPPEFEYILR